MISLATSGGRYLPSADWAKRFCSEPTARAAAPTPMKASSQPAPQPKAGRSSVSTSIAWSRNGRPADQADLDDQHESEPPAATARTRRSARRRDHDEDRREPQGPAAGSAARIRPSSCWASICAWTSRPLVERPVEAGHRRLEIVEVADVAADQDVAAAVSARRTRAVDARRAPRAAGRRSSAPGPRSHFVETAAPRAREARIIDGCPHSRGIPDGRRSSHWRAAAAGGGRAASSAASRCPRDPARA